MNDNDGERLASVLVENSLVYLTMAETEAVNEDCGEFLVPSSSCLFQTIKGPAEAQDSCSKVFQCIPWRWFHVYDLSSSQVTIQVSPLDVDLVEFHAISICDGEDGLDQWQLGYRCVSVEVINSRYLTEPLCDQASFVPDDVP